jgi:hypothetical protein
VRIAVGGLSVSHTFGRGDDPLEGVVYNADADFKILLMHYGVEGTIHPDATEPILSKDSLAKVCVDLIGVGHVHDHRKMMLGSTTVIVPGSTERHTFGEKGVQPGFYCLEVDKRGLRKVEHVDVIPQQMREESVKTSELGDEDPTGSLIERIREVSGTDQMLKVVLFGPMASEKFHKLRLREAYMVGLDTNFYFDLDSRGLHVSDGPRLVSDGTARASISQRQEIAEVAAELMELAQTDSERALYAEARDRVLASYL